MTLPELFAMFDAHAVKMRRRYEVSLLTAWQTANLSRAKKLPKFSSLMKQFASHQDGPQTPKQMLGVLQQLAERTGFPMRSAAHG